LTLRLGAGAGLPDDKREMNIELAVDHPARSSHNRVGDLRLEQAFLALTLAAASLMRQRMHVSIGMRSPPIGKFSRERSV
jgi:hypothetical protein